MPGKDYLAMAKVEPGDKLDYGVKGMKWGVRRGSQQLKSEGGTRLPPRSHEPQGGGKDDTRLPPRSHEPQDSKSDGPQFKSEPRVKGAKEPSAERYARLREQAKLGKARNMSEEDLKFFNARTEALAKINKMNQSDPGWLSTTTKTVMQNVAQRTMQEITEHIAKKYITVPVTNAIGEAVKKK